MLKWGDEIEYMLVKFNHQEKRVQLSLRGAEVSLFMFVNLIDHEIGESDK